MSSHGKEAPTLATESFRDKLGTYDVVGLRSQHAEIAIAPQAGAKIISLLDREHDREWTWAADRAKGLFANEVGDAFDDSPLIGVDECIPTIAPCEIDGQPWPDHGEAWSRAWELDDQALLENRLITSIRLQTVPMSLRREITLAANKLRFSYALSNHSDEAHPYAWALHPLLAHRHGDVIELPAGSYAGRVDSAANLPGLGTNSRASWPEVIPGVRVDRLLEGTEDTSLKLYVPSPTTSEFTVFNAEDGTRLHGRYGPAALLPWLGVWVTRGGWSGYHHFALEPTNVEDDHADRIDRKNHRAAVLSPKETREWFAELTIGNENL